MEAARAVILSLLLVIPSFWQPHVQAGDFSSHLYNAWLAGELANKPVAGVNVVHPSTNVLADQIISALLIWSNVYWTERIMASLAILIFFWGAMFLIHTTTGRTPWSLAPCLAMISYGSVFQLGFLNHYLSTGLSLWAMALVCIPTATRLAGAGVLALLALTAHPLPLIWAIGVYGFIQISRRVNDSYKAMAFLGSLGLIFLAQFVVTRRLSPQMPLDQQSLLEDVLGFTASDQVWLFGLKYLWVAAGFFSFWILLLSERFRKGGMFKDHLVHLWLLHCAAFLIFPSAVYVPGYANVLAFIPQRVSMFTAIILCLVVGAAPYSRAATRLSFLTAIVFFSFLYVDNRAFNNLETEVTELVSTLGPGQRVVAGISDSATRLPVLTHVLDRPCIGRCFSYGNYEPATGQFRIRAYGANSVVAHTMVIVREIEDGHHVVTPQESPIYAICPCAEQNQRRLCLRLIPPGETTCGLSIRVAPSLRAK